MPRRSGGGARAAPRPVSRSPPAASVPARAPPAAPVAAAPAAVGQPRQPGMFAQMATTAAGVAVGSAIGHTLGATMMGGGGGHQEQQPVATEQQAQPFYAQPQQAAGAGPCQLQMKQFLECAQTQHDITLCQGFNEALRECKMSYGLSA